MHRNRKNRKIIIYALIGVLMLMAVGYASFQSSLSIKGSSKVTSNWDIEITNITDGVSTGLAENGKDEHGNILLPQISEDKLSALISSDLYEPGDSMTYVVTIQNKGSLDAIIDDIIPTQNDGNNNVMENEAVKITFSGYTKGQKLYKQGQANSTLDVTVKVEYNEDYTGGETTFETNLEFIFKQAESKEIIDDEVISEDSHKVTYDYISSGGNKKTYEQYYKEGEEIDLTRDINTPYDIKDEYIFKGWNTDLQANDCIKEGSICKTSMTMGNGDVHLYAIYEEDNITINSINTTSTTNSITVVVDAIADSGVKKIEYSKDNGNSWEESSQEENIDTHRITNLTQNTDYPIKIRVTSMTNKNISQSKQGDNCNVSEGTEYLFPYTGLEQTFTPACRGTYTLETWGAQGGSITYNSVDYTGGYGGYATGKLLINKNETLFINVGGKGNSGIANETKNYGDGGYNGGGSRSGWTCPSCTFYSSGGGGATHIARTSGLLSSFKTKRNDIIMVSGGGGGNGYINTGSNTNFNSIASGGGYKGVNGNSNGSVGKGGSSEFDNYFGYGRYANNGVADGGGGGYYGGEYGLNGAGGGSGYIGNPELTDKKMVCYNCDTSSDINLKTETNMCSNASPIPNCSKQNDGYAKITLNTKSTTPYTSKLNIPTYVENNTGEITINYPQGCTNYTCTYKINDGNEVTVNSSQVSIKIGQDGTIIGYVKDKENNEIVNIVSSSYNVIRKEFYVKSTGNDNNGYGTLNSPYATLNKAYSSTNNLPSTIYIMDNINQTSSLTINSKKITMKSYNYNQAARIINDITVINGSLTLEDIKLNFKSSSDNTSYKIYPNNSTLKINNSEITGGTSGANSTLWLRESNNIVEISNSYIHGPYAIGGEGGKITINNSKIEGTVYQGINVNGNYCTNLTVKGDTQIIGAQGGIYIYASSTCGSTITLDGNISSKPYVIGKGGKGINIMNSNSTLNFNYGDIYGISGISNVGTSVYRAGTTFKEENTTIDGKTYIHSYLS